MSHTKIRPNQIFNRFFWVDTVGKRKNCISQNNAQGKAKDNQCGTLFVSP